ncbi:MAG: c-type cytochrome domain-containing protein [Planctomycetaceae bacterium]
MVHGFARPMRAFSIVLLACAQAATGPAPARAADSIAFNRDIRPILSDNCFSCHGPDAGHRQADLRLDVRDAAVAAGAIVPGKPAESTVVARITATDPDTIMPPPDSHKKLDAKQRELLARWIAEGRSTSSTGPTSPR